MIFRLIVFFLAGVSALGASAQQFPKTALIHGETWKLIRAVSVSEDPSDDAVTSCPGHTIKLRRDLTGKGLAGALVHELMHALACDHGLPADQKWNNSNDEADGCEGHCGIYWGSKELLEFFLANPEIVLWIYRHGRE